jgi:hypothetical protein
MRRAGKYYKNVPFILSQWNSYHGYKLFKNTTEKTTKNFLTCFLDEFPRVLN